MTASLSQDFPHIAGYRRLFEAISPALIEQADAHVHPDIHFQDPFNDFQGLDLFKALLRKTLKDVQNPCFTVTHQAHGGDCVFLRWTFQGELKSLGDWAVTGMSEIHFASDGRICKHIDYWDAGAQFYSKLPALGPLIRFIQRRLQVS